MHDLVIRGAAVVDGTGAPRRSGDIAIDGEVIVAVGDDVGAGTQEIDADGLVVTPGFVDVHTHLDAQLLWDPEMLQSAVHGVTTAVMGNCGVGIAPARPDDRAWIADLLDGVEDIPASILNSALDWDWESFEQYLDVVDRGRYTFDVAAHVPHSAIRRYVMGDRAADSAPASDDDIAAMATHVRRALQAGAIGVSTSRTVNHKSRSTGSPIITLSVPHAEVRALADACGATGAGVVQLVSDLMHSTDDAYVDDELDLLASLAATGRPVSVSLLQNPAAPHRYQEVLERVARLRAGGADLWTQVAPRSVGGAYSADSPSFPLTRCKTYRAAASNATELTRQLRDPQFERAVSDEFEAADAAGRSADLSRVFGMSDDPQYFPAPSESIARIAQRTGTSVVSVLFDLARSTTVGDAVILIPFVNYNDGDPAPVREMVEFSGSLLGLSDSGAHCTTICDASFPTYAMSYWTRDVDGAPIPTEYIVHVQTQRAANYLGLTDRGVVAPGQLADLNVIDLEHIAVRRPKLVHDLPGGAARYVQDSTGYRATVKRGTVVMDEGRPTGERTGRLVRGAQHP